MCQPKLIKKTYGDFIAPIDETDKILWKWCNKKNNELRKALEIIERAKTDHWLYPIHVGIMGDYSIIGKDKILEEWCQEQNAKIKNNELTIVAIQQGIEYGRFGMDEQFVQDNSEEMLQKAAEERVRRWDDRLKESWVDILTWGCREKNPKEASNDNQDNDNCDTLLELTDLSVEENTVNEDHDI